MSELPSLSILDDLLDDAPLPVLWLALLLAAPLLAIPVIIFWIGPGLMALFGTTLWRQLLLPPLLVIYTVLIVPRLQRLRADVVTGLWPIIDAGERDHEELLRGGPGVIPGRGGRHCRRLGARDDLQRAGHPLPHGAVDRGRGCVHPRLDDRRGIVYYCVQIARSTNRLLELPPLTIDLFDLRPFAPIGFALGMAMSLAFFGGILLSLLVGFNEQSSGRFRSSGSPMDCSWPSCSASFSWSYASDPSSLGCDQGGATGGWSNTWPKPTPSCATAAPPGDGALELAADITAWTAYQRALNETRTWPYNTRLLRTLTITVLSPLALGAARLIGILLTAD
ncbi:MAG: hypothetical protein R2854_12400 [Caldilineaceae bacterium]